jgi:hypothetical protein
VVRTRQAPADPRAGAADPSARAPIPARGKMSKWNLFLDRQQSRHPMILKQKDLPRLTRRAKTDIHDIAHPSLRIENSTGLTVWILRHGR